MSPGHRLQDRLITHPRVAAMAADWAVGEKCDVVGGAVGDDSVFERLGVKWVEAILHAHNRAELLGRFDLVDVDVRQPDVFDLPSRLQVDQRSHAVSEGDVVVWSVKLVEVDALRAEGDEALFARFLEMVRSAVGGPVAPRSLQAAFRCHQDPSPGSLYQGFGDQPFVVTDVGIVDAIDVGGVDEGDAGVNRCPDDLEALRLVRATADRERHAAQTDGAHRKSATADGALLHRPMIRRPEAGILSSDWGPFLSIATNAKRTNVQ